MADPDQASQLYRLPLPEFTAARNELAGRLRKQGQRAASDAVKALAKPSITAWALNQVARRQPALVEDLLAAGEELARAQQRLLAGRGQAEFREAGQVEKRAVARLVQAAATVLAETGQAPGKPLLDRLEATARAAATDPAGGELLRAGRLSADLDPTGFGELGGFGLPAALIPFPRGRAGRVAQPAPTSREDENRAKRRAETRDDERRQERLAQAHEDVRRLQRELQALRKEAGEAEGEAARARQAASKTERAWAEARNAVARAETLASEARRAEEDAAESLAAVRARLDQTAEEMERAEAELREARES